MSKPARPRYRMLRLILPLFILIFGCFTPEPPPPVGPSADEANVAILGDVDRLAPGSQASFLVQPRAPYSMQRWPDAIVEVYLNAPNGDSRQVFSGITGADGIANVNFAVPADLASTQQVLEIRTQLPQDENGPMPTEAGYRTYRDVYVGRAYNVLVSTDKPVYQPGQVIHIRGLGLDTLDMHAADGMTMTLTVADPQGNKLLRKELTTSAFGIASADFPLDTQAHSGDYAITAQMGPTVSTRSVEVKPYSLPRFEVTFNPDSTFYLPGETASGAVEAHYFFGKPVAGGQVSLRGTLNDGSGEHTVVELNGATDAEGRYTYSFVVPDSLKGQLDNKSLDIDLEIVVTDTADHSESIDDTVTVAEKVLLIEAIPESGLLRRGIDDLVYLDVTYPDGVAAQAVLTVTDSYSQTFAAVTDAYGQAVITLTTPNDGLTPLVVTAVDTHGNEVVQPLLLGTEEGSSASLLLRPARAEYRVGDTLDVDIVVAGDVETVYLDIIKDQQTFGMAALPVSDGIARAAIDIDGSLLGTLELNAYSADAAGQIARDRRYVLVNPAPAEVTVSADKAEYRPGETAVLDIQVSRNQRPQQAAVGVAIVDESVYAVQDADSHFARTYFLLNRELQEAHYGLHNFVDLESGDPSPYDAAPDSVRYADASARQVALSGAFAEVLAQQASAQARAGLAPDGAIPATQPFDPWMLASAWGNRIYLVAPLLGLALYDGSRNRRRLLIGLVVFSLGAFVWGACAPAAAPAPAEQQALEGTTTAIRDEKPPRLRQFFPETLYWMPELVTDDQGRAQLEVPMADSITTWRASLLVSDKQGNLGSTELGLRAFQDFFVEPDLPRFLTVGDEIDVPIAVYNYLGEPQSIELTVAPDAWFELRAEPQLVFEAGANEVMAAYLPIRVTEFGKHELQITATGSNMSDAVLREVEVLPNGQRVAEVTGSRMQASQQVTLPIPAEAIPGTSRVTVKVFPGVVSQVLAGLEGMLQMPYGCFEQTSSATYPNVLVLDYLKRTGQASPRVELQADYLISLGYQRLIGFEVDGEPGGFSLFGDPPANSGITAYGLLEFGDMAKVAYVDPDLLARMVDFLAERQNRDGSWDAYGAAQLPEMDTADYKLATTAYITWGLADAGYADDRTVRQAVRYLERSLNRVDRQATGSGAPPPTENDSFNGHVEVGAVVSPLATPPPPNKLSNNTLALMANALIASNGDAIPVIEQLLERAEREDGQAYWTPGTETYLGSYGSAATVEVTAVVAQALLRSDTAPDLAQQALDFLIANRDPNGSFYTTQATIQALKALLLAASPDQAAEDATVTVTYTKADGTESTQTIGVEASNFDVVQQVVLENVAPGAVLSLAVDGDRELQYQVVSEYYLPWEEATATATVAAPMRIAVSYDRSELSVNELLGVRADVELLTGDTAGTVIVDLGLPPGFAPVIEDLDALVADGRIDRYELTGRQILLYLTNVASGRTYTFEYRLQPRYALTAQAPSSQVYDYYAPDQRASDPPQRITVTLGTP